MTTLPPRTRTVTVAVAVLAMTACGAAPEALEMSEVPAGTTAPATSTPSAPGSASDVVAAARAYVDAVNARDLDALVASFARDAEIVDVSRSIRGHDAIRAWADREVIGGTLRVVSIAERRADGQKLLVHWAPAGSGGWQAHYDFTVGGGRIVKADLQYA
ncbi:nuclear transport factor 2 family protein [Nonomuraea purpurea]|uniref:Nuclear transport factor 2 family protein n=1 Tax=Nonomuraea purpurea TaxID=1849276 RepID=A0ABV8G8F7_9ACTN